MVYVERLLKFSTAAIAVVLLASCSQKQGSTSSIKIVLPSASSQKLSQSVSAQSFDFTVACFAVNVTGPMIPQTANSCSPAVGVFSGFKPSGSTVTMEVPMGSARKIEVYLFNRALATDTCPSDFSALTPDKIALVGSVGGVEMNQPDVSVNLQVTAPVAGVNLTTQNVVPASCVVAAVPADPTTQRLVLGSQTANSAAGYQIKAQVTSIKTMNEISSPAGYKMLIGPKGL